MLTLNAFHECFAHALSTKTIDHNHYFTVGGILTGITLLYLLVESKKKKQSKTIKTIRDLPVPSSTLPLLGNTLDLIAQNERLHDWFADVCNQFNGQTWALSSWGMPQMIVVSSPEGFEDVMKTQFDVFGKGPTAQIAWKDLLGTSITIADGESWKFQRRILAKLFSASALRDSMATIVTKHAETLDHIFRSAMETKEPLDLAKLMSTFTFEVFTEIGYGVHLGALASGKPHASEHAFEDALYVLANRSTMPRWLWKLQRWLNVGMEAKLKRALAAIDDMTRGVISQAIEINEQNKRSSKIDIPQDILSLFLRHSNTSDNDKDGDSPSQQVDYEMVRGVTITALAAGRDTSAEAIAWFFYCLSEHPEVERKVREELREKLPQLATATDSGKLFPTMDELPQLTYLEAALREVMRLYPPAPFNARHTFEDTVLHDGTFIPQGTMVIIPSYASLRLKSVWGPDAAEFKPERFIDPATGKLRQFSSYKYNVFNNGPRICLGIHLAMLEIVLVTAGLLSRYSIVVVPGQTVTYERSLSLPMKYPFMVQIHPLTCSPAA